MSTQASSEAPAPSEATPPAAGRAGRPDRWFGIKDLFTTINAMGGVVAICLCIEGQPFWAGVSMLLGYLFGDTLDGYVARKLGTSNQFGAEYDTIADHLSHCIAPGAIVYTVYRGVDLGFPPWAQQGLAIVLGGSIMVTASIRHARNIVRPIEVKGIWAGLPRTVLGFLAVAYVNARLAPHLPGGYWVGVVLIPASCVAALTYLPFPSHRMSRGHFGYVRIVILFAFLTTIGIGVVYPEFVFDLLLFWMLGYSTASWMSMTRPERDRYFETVRRALAEAKT
ncbi:MAG TPA: CDP-alcohol phosphatidyltransferase family protein [Kofleriaceae bacterium]|nr:CDP-alcohol phosphatidyltransferase family protein [Kofleriaceae bacterium]